jgi:site-specific recombinase XerD
MDIHNYKRQFERNLERIDQDKNISKEKGLSICRINRYIFELRKYNSLLKKSFSKATKSDIRRVVAKIEQSDLAPETKKYFKIMLKKLYRFLKGIEEPEKYPEEVEWICTRIPENHRKLPEELLTEEEINKIIQKCETLRNKTMIAVLAESGCRISEIGLLKIKHISFEEYGARLTVNGKTGMRKILVINSTPYLQEWINQHPFNDNPESYLWVNKNGDLLSYKRIANILKNAAKRVKIKKRVYPHLLRHSRATILAAKMSDAALKHYFGWTQASKMAATYIHMSGKDTDEAILSINGIEIDKSKKKNVMKPKKCLRCKTINSSTNKFCKLCGLVLEEEKCQELIKTEMERKNMDEIMNKLINDKDVLKVLVEKIKGINPKN